MATFYLVFFIITAFPVFAYPAVLLANFMYLAGHGRKYLNKKATWLSNIFLLSTTLYPITYLFSLYKYRNTPPESHYIWAGLVLAHIIFIFLSFISAAISEEKSKNDYSASTDKEEEKDSKE